MSGYLIDNNKKKNMPWLMLALGFVFIFNPNVSIIDVLPDFIGYIIIGAALIRPSMLCETLADAKRSFEKMILVDIGKTLALLWVFGVDSLSERASSLLLWSFVFGVLEVIFLIPAYIKLFKGISVLGDYYSNSSIHGTAKGKRSTFTEKMRNSTIAFVLFKAIMCVLPELSDFGNTVQIENHSFINLYRYIGVIRLLCVIPVIVAGIAWLTQIVKYFRRISKDTEFNAALAENYETNIVPKKGLFAIRYVTKASWFMVFAAVLTLDFSLEGVNIMPDILVVALIIPAFVYFSKTASLRKRTVYIFAVLFAMFSLAAVILNSLYFDLYPSYNALSKDSKAFTLYMSYVIAVALQGVSFVCMLSALTREIKKVVMHNTGYVLGKEINSEGEQRRINEVHTEIGKSFSKILNFAAIYVFSDVVYSLYGAIYAFMRKEMGYLGVLNGIFGILFICAVVGALDELKDAVKTKYMLE